ncbi:MAG: hypothetical protein ABSA02_27740 [Trebonia sp.]
MTDPSIPASHRDLLESTEPVTLAAYGTDLASFNGPLEGRVSITLRPTRVVALG